MSKRVRLNSSYLDELIVRNVSIGFDDPSLAPDGKELTVVSDRVANHEINLDD